MAYFIAIRAAGGLIVEVAKCAFGPVKRHVCYFFNHDSRVKFLNDQLEKLKDERDRMQHRADAATRNGGQIEQDAQKWLTKVHKKIREDAEQLQKYEDEAKKRCFVGLCPDFLSNYHLSKKAEEEAILVVQLLTEAKQFSAKEISFGPDPQLMVATSAPQGFEFFKSREVVMQGIMKALQDPNNQKIGVFGMGGVGKTMLMKQVASITKRDNLFDEVAIATISNSQKTNIGSIQGEIADALGLKFDEESVRGRANRLRQRLNDGKSILVILDDVWEKIDLEAVGIIFQQNQNMSKLLLTSRSIDTLRIHMNVDATLELTTLSSEESMVLFTKTVGNKVGEPDYQPVAIDVVAKCAGLPVAISAVANALKEKNIAIWNNCLQQLKRANPKSIEGLEKSVYSALKLSYEYLQYRPAQTLLLLCSLQPQGQDILVSDLIKYSWGMDLLEDVCTMEEARGNMTALIQKLKGSSLILNGDNDTVFRMHDIVRDVCNSIASEENQMFVIEEQVRLEKLLKSRKLENCTALSLPYSDIGELPNLLNCPQLDFFLFYSKSESLKVPDCFFKETKKLKVLHLTGIEFSTLPSSFLSLTNLQTLCLDHCTLQNIAIIGQLKNLEVLSFSNSDIKELPIELKNLSMLKLLDLSNCYELDDIPENLISSLCCLEELYMGNSFDGWDMEDNASLFELKYLFNLAALEIYIRDAQIIPTNLFSENLERYKIFIGEDLYWNGKHERSRTLKLELNTDMYLDHGIEMLLKKTEELCLIMALKGVMNVLSMLDGAGTHLKDLYVVNSGNEGEITETSSLSVPLFNHKGVLSYLESLVLTRISIPRIWDDEASIHTTNLTSFIMSECDNLENLFSTSMAKCLKQLKHLEVVCCNNMIEVIATEAEETRDVLLFSNLDSLELDGLPKLTRFSGNLIEFSSLRELSIKYCPLLKSFISNAATMETMIRSEVERNDSKEDGSCNIPTLFYESVSIPKLERLTIDGLPNLRKIWHEQLFPESFNNLNYFYVRNCDRLLSIFPIKMLGRLQRLQRLHILYCGSVEEIFECEEPNLWMSSTIRFELATVKVLEFQGLPKLKSFSYKVIECPSLRMIEVCGCDEVQSIFCFKEYISFRRPQQEEESQPPLFWVNKIGFPSLEELSLESNENLKYIWEGQLPSQCFPHLKLLSLSSMDKLSYEGSKAVLPMTQLNVLRLNNLDELRCVLDEKLEPLQKVFYKMTTLQVSNCRKLKNLLVPSSISFSNLMNMTISYCHGLKTVLTHSTAKSLVHLTAMEISYCDKIKEIITKDGAKDGIVFTQLKCVELIGLTKLEGFCLGNSSFELPSLDKLIVTNCTKMKIFCQGEVLTPKLRSVNLQNEERLWSVYDGDLNNSIHQIYKNQVGFNIGFPNQVGGNIEQQPF